MGKKQGRRTYSDVISGMFIREKGCNTARVILELTRIRYCSLIMSRTV